MRVANSISGKTADLLGNDHVDRSRHVRLYHSVAFLFATFRSDADSVICEYSYRR